VGHERVQRHGGDEAQVQRTGRGQVRLGQEFLAGLMQIDFLRAKLEGMAAGTKRFQLHAQHARIEIDAGRLVAGGQYQVIQVVYHMFLG
jgi:hypothetical protein